MTVTELPLSDELDEALNAVSDNKTQFIIDALKQKLKETKIEAIKDNLIEGYKSSYNESERLLNDFKNVDLEHWDEY